MIVKHLAQCFSKQQTQIHVSYSFFSTYNCIKKKKTYSPIRLEKYNIYKTPIAMVHIIWEIATGKPQNKYSYPRGENKQLKPMWSTLKTWNLHTITYEEKIQSISVCEHIHDCSHKVVYIWKLRNLGWRRNPRLLTNRTIVEFGKNRYILLLAGQRLTTLVSGGSHSVDSPQTPYLWS